MEKEWYLLQTFSGHEERVKSAIEKRVATQGLEDKVAQIIIPEEEVYEIKGGKRATSKIRLFPGYILVNMELSDETWHTVRYTPGIFGFLGDRLTNKPIPLAKEEIEKILSRISAKEVRPKQKVDLEVGETVRITAGPFKNFIGTIGEMDIKRGKAKVMTNLLGRITSIEMDIYQLQRL
jgi:transcriptional antiterminator NusG